MASSPEGTENEPQELDYRFTLANERTFLAWMRTCLALLAAALAVVQFAPALGSKAFREVCGLVFIVLAFGCAAGGLWRWLSTQRAMREGRHLRPGPLPSILSVGLALIALAVFAIVVRGLGR